MLDLNTRITVSEMRGILNGAIEFMHKAYDEIGNTNDIDAITRATTRELDDVVEMIYAIQQKGRKLRDKE